MGKRHAEEGEEMKAEETEKKNSTLVTVSPHISHPANTANIMWSVTACLVPAGVWGIYVFGIQALYVVLVSIAAAAGGELIMARLLKRNCTIGDGSAVLTGLLVGYNMPPAVPLFIPIIASIFAIVVVKWTFGGLGGNWMNPALAGRVFVFFSWTGPMAAWTLPRTVSVDGITGASPLSFIKAGLYGYSGGAAGPAEFLAENGFPHTLMDERVTGWLREHLFPNIQNGYADIFTGNVAGCIGEVSALFLLLGTVYLFARKIITWHVPVSYIFSFGVLTWIFGGLRFGSGFFSGDVVFHLFTGGLVLGAFYMATDMVTSPLTGRGMIIFGIGTGVFTFLIRFYGSFPEGVSLAILLMNIFVPLINRLTGPKRFGVPKETEAAS
jgi:Na+-translocating ferredoxin:NAD+ oxidoreductase subunit D